MTKTTTVLLDAKMQEIVDMAKLAGLGPDASTIVRLALEDWWSDQLIASIGRDDVQRLLEEAAEDTSPGLPADEVFARLLKEFRPLEHEGSDAA